MSPRAIIRVRSRLAVFGSSGRGAGPGSQMVERSGGRHASGRYVQEIGRPEGGAAGWERASGRGDRTGGTSEGESVMRRVASGWLVQVNGGSEGGMVRETSGVLFGACCRGSASRHLASPTLYFASAWGGHAKGPARSNDRPGLCRQEYLDPRPVHLAMRSYQPRPSRVNLIWCGIEQDPPYVAGNATDIPAGEPCAPVFPVQRRRHASGRTGYA